MGAELGADVASERSTDKENLSRWVRTLGKNNLAGAIWRPRLTRN